MYSLKNTFLQDREKLADQYVNAWYNDEAGARVQVLKEEMLALADALEGQPKPVVKARCFAYLLENAPVYVNADDWFGISLEAAKMSKLKDVGMQCGLLLRELSKKWSRELYSELNKPEDAHFRKHAKDLLLNEFYIDYNHSTPCWEDILGLGVSGLLDRVLSYRAKLSPLTAEQEAYFDGIEITYRAFLRLLDRYIEALAGREEPRRVIMRDALMQLRENPPANTYEAMLLAWIWWYVQEQVDGIRVRTMGGIDQLYRRFFEADVASGHFTEDDIREMLCYFMNGFYAMRVIYQQPMYFGGRDADGKCVVNRLSYLALEAYNLVAAPNPKLQVKIGKNTPEAFLRAVIETIRNGNSGISIINEDIAAASLMKLGVPEREAISCLMSGCWDYTVKNHEVKTIPVRVSLPKVLEYTLYDGYCQNTGERVGCEVGTEFADFSQFYEAFVKQWHYIFSRIRGVIEHWELYLAEISPSNLFSGTMVDSLAQGVDGYARGMKYNTTVLSIAGLATLVDSLCVIKKFVFDEKQITLDELRAILRANWQGHETLRKSILHDGDKYGNGSEMADDIMVRLAKLLGEVNGVPNSRGSYWKMGALSIDKNVRLGDVLGATPDGRLAGEPYSKNLSPVIGMDRKGVTAFLNSVSKIDFTDFSHAGMLDVILHPSAVSGEDGLTAFCALIKTYFARGGHSLQFNVFSAEMLRAAQREPEKYRSLQIRVCGWNVYFVDLEKVLQDDFIRQCENSEATGF